ncbi:holin-like protein CidA [Paenibacillus antibioticophila]|uniref:Holin-like protein CidA n=1 Tax=Paenibacillus antibioticophila TaxID=1274374 RepID=A0A920CFT0_9BACL|nr:CidA/LrgA family holin-like protein [Paenibacillus antibioticophila]GIO35349.1 holin-like protein CidA [Paenibacillus antibioticophila]
MNIIRIAAKIVLQVILLILFTLAMNALAQWLHLPIPGTILGIIVLFLLLKLNIVKLDWIEAGASWLLAELLLFFIPAAVGIMEYIPMLQNNGIQILIVVLSSTVIVMVSSGLIATRISRRKERKTT